MSIASRPARLALALAAVIVPSVALAQPSHTAATPPPGAATPPPAAPAHETGLLLEIRYEPGDGQLVRDPFGNAQYVPAAEAAIFAGYQHRRWSVGVGFQLGRNFESNDGNTTMDDVTDTTFMLVPGARVALERSSDGRAELIGVLDLGFGESRRGFDAGVADDEVVERFQLQLGPGLRYWLGPSFAFGASALVRHARFRVEREDSFTGQVWTSEVASTRLASSLHVSGVF